MNNHVEQLTRIYNTLLLINTKGDDTLVMADCIRAFKQEIEQMTQEANAQVEE